MPKPDRPRLTEEEFNLLIESLPEGFDENPNNSDNLHIYRDLYVQSRMADLDESSKTFYKTKYLHALLTIGFQLKEQWMKDMSFSGFGYDAIRQFQLAIKIEPNLPIAHYRLGHIYFKENELGKAAGFFETSLNVHYPNFELEEYQIRNAKTILSYCGIMLYQQHSQKENQASQYPELENAIESFLNQKDRSFNPVIKVSYSGGQKRSVQELSIADYDELCLSSMEDRQVFLIDQYSRHPTVNYCERQVTLTQTTSDTLLTLLDRSFEEEWNHIAPPTRRKRIERLRDLIHSLTLPQNELEIINPSGADPYIQSDLNIVLLKQIEE